MKMVRTFMRRLRGRPSIHIRYPPTNGEQLVKLIAQERGMSLTEHIADTGSYQEQVAVLHRNVDLVKGVQNVVIFDDGSVEHLVNLSNKQDKLLHHYKEV